MSGEFDAERWERSKENIQPLKHGRKATVLSVALDENATQKLNAVRHQFELEVRTYTGDDPLDVWYRYTLWVEQNYPKGGKEGNLRKVIEKCLTAILTDSNLNGKYTNDSRFLDLWIKYASFSPSPPEIYQTLEVKELCTGLADFYINWSWEIEKLGNYKRADSIYQKGIQCRAAPMDVLEDAHKKFQVRIARSTVEGTLPEAEPGIGDAQRVALTALKPQGRKNQATVDRVGSSVIGPAGRVPLLQQSASNMSGPAFQIFQDGGSENQQPRGPPGDCRSGALPVHASRNKENVKEPSKWTNAKTSQKTTGLVPVEDVNKYQQATFSVHEDEETRPTATPAKLPQTSNVLSTRKNQYEDWNVPMFLPEPFDPMVQPQYCKHKVYCGTEEFSFEELHAAQYFKKERERKEKERERKEKEARFHSMQEQLTRQEEMIKSLKESLRLSQQPADQDDALECNQPQQKKAKCVPEVVVSSQPLNSFGVSGVQVVQDKKRPENTSRNVFQDSWISVNKSVNYSVNVSVNVSNLHDESPTSDLLHCQPAAATVSSKESSAAEILTPKTASNSGIQDTSRGLGLASPTVNTKMQMNMIRDMWSVSLFKEDSRLQEAPEVVSEPAPVAGAPFAIYQDEKATKPPPPVKPVVQEASLPVAMESAGLQAKASESPFTIFSDSNPNASNSGASNSQQPFTVFEDATKTNSNQASGLCDSNDKYRDEQDENISPAGLIQVKENRILAGILQPATNIPVQPLDDPMCEEEEKHEAEKCDKGNQNEDNEMDGIEPIDVDLANFTLKMPTNPEAFVKMAKVASTPGPWSLGQIPQATPIGDDFTMAFARNKDFIKLSEVDEEEKEDSTELMPPPCATSQAAAPSTPPPANKPYLSPIMEASREYRSSSSSSSGCSESRSATSSTLGSHLVHGLTQHGGGLSTTHTSRSRCASGLQPESVWEGASAIQTTGDLTKSGYLADKSRGESLADNKSHQLTSQVRDDDTFDPKKAAAMMMEMDDMMWGLPSKDAAPSQKPSVQDKPSATTQNAREPKTASQNVQSAKPEKINPLAEEVSNNMLGGQEESVHKRGGLVQLETKLPEMKINTQLRDDDTFDPKKAAAMMMEMDDMMWGVPSKDAAPSQKPSVQDKPNATTHNAREPRTASKNVQSAKLPEIINPFAEEVLNNLLGGLEEPVHKRGGFVQLETKLPNMKINTQITLGSEMFHVRRIRGEGAYATVFQASTIDPLNVTILPTVNCEDSDDEDEDEEKQMILKVQKPATPWEFYICHELRQRLKSNNAPLNVLDSVMRINRGYFFTNGSILVNQFHKYGTILDAVNSYKTNGESIPENIVMFFTIEVLTILEAVHSCGIIHADVKPDNFLIQDIPSGADGFSCWPTSLKLIDFGRSIDMKLLPEGTTFAEKVTTQGFTCCEMREGKPWTYHTDLYGVAAIAHILLFGSYMDVKKSPKGVWELKGVTFKRYWQKEMWQSVFFRLLNAPSCSDLPSLAALKDTILQTFLQSKIQENMMSSLRKLLYMVSQKKTRG